MQTENLYAQGQIRTFTGKYLSIFDPQADQIDIVDIAHGLSNMPRFGGQLAHFYSVAQHSIAVASMVEKQHQLAALLHDASEAYLMDLPGPIKKRLPDYKATEHRLMEVIAEKFGFEYPLHPQVKSADDEALVLEWETLHLKQENYFTPYWVAKEWFLECYMKVQKFEKLILDSRLRVGAGIFQLGDLS